MFATTRPARTKRKNRHIFALAMTWTPKSKCRQVCYHCNSVLLRPSSATHRSSNDQSAIHPSNGAQRQGLKDLGQSRMDSPPGQRLTRECPDPAKDGEARHPAAYAGGGSERSNWLSRSQPFGSRNFVRRGQRGHDAAVRGAASVSVVLHSHPAIVERSPQIHE